jgi:biopolymer transport protein ExbB
MKRARSVFALALLVAAGAARAAEPAAKTLDELLEQVRTGRQRELAEQQRRETEFRAKKDEQAALLAQARAARTAEEQRSAQLERQFQDNETKLAELQALLQNRMGTLGELFGVVRQVAGDTRGLFENSIVSAQIPGRLPFLDALGQTRALPKIEKLEHLWFLLQQEMTETGKVVRFPATVVRNTGGETKQEIIRVGAFNLLGDGEYLRWLPEVGKVAQLGRQPGARHLAALRNFTAARDGLAGLAVDPSRGAILALLIQWPDRRERVDQGGPIGYFTIVLGLIGGAVGLWRLLDLYLVGRKVRAQRASNTVHPDNPLGRVLAVHEQHRTADVETLDLKLDEAILKETAHLERFLWAVKVISVVAPLLGLLGTITGMIQAFQVMTLFGTGDPKLMAGGIAEALVTTMIGLMVAIPLVLLHSALTTFSGGVAQILDEQSAGLIAARAEREEAGAAAA